MGKILVVILVVLSFGLFGCDAFKDYYDAAPPVQKNPLPEPAEGTPPEGGGGVIDYSIDKTVCEHISSVAVDLPIEDKEVTNSGWTAESTGELAASVLAEKKGEYTTSINVSKSSEKLSFTLKQVAEKTFSVCDVILEGCPSGDCMGVKSLWTEVKEGVINLYDFNKAGESESIINSGEYNFTFGESNMGDPGLSLEGGYFTDVVGEAFEVK